MKSLSQVFSALRKKNLRQYALLTGCCFFSVLLITAYVCMMRSPTVLAVLPEGGDSRKQVMMIFALAVVGCGAFVTYASGLFFRYKSRETGVLMALGASKKQLMGQLAKEVTAISFGSCALGASLGAPLALAIWQVFRLTLVDTQDMALRFDRQAYSIAFAFSAFVILMLYVMLFQFIRRTNIMDVVNESRKSEAIRDVKKWYGPVGILLLIGGALLGYMTPVFCVQALRWYPPEGLTAIAYLPALIGLYMIMLHTVVNGWRKGKNRYKNIISTSMMKFQGRQTVRNMLVITVLIAGAYFGAFYSPMLGTGAMMNYDARPVDYAFHYRADQDMPNEDDIRQMADENNVVITSYNMQAMAVLGVDGEEQVEEEGNLGVTYTMKYRELLQSDLFLSESAYNSLTGQAVDIPSGRVAATFDHEGDNSGWMSTDVSVVTNVLTGETLSVTPMEETLRSAMLFGRRVLDDDDYAAITAGLNDQWREWQVFFNVENDARTYDFAKLLFNVIVDSSGTEVEVVDAWDAVHKMRSDEAGIPYWADKEVQDARGDTPVSFEQRDASTFRLNWKYMPQFRVMDKADFVKTTAVFLMLFVFIAIMCFAAVIVIAYTRSLTIGITSAQVYDDLRHLGAKNDYLLKTVRAQISKVFFAPIATGTVIIFAFYMMIMFFNDGGSFGASEIVGLLNCLLLVAVISALFYLVYRFTLRNVCRMLGINIHQLLTSGRLFNKED